MFVFRLSVFIFDLAAPASGVSVLPDSALYALVSSLDVLGSIGLPH